MVAYISHGFIRNWQNRQITASRCAYLMGYILYLASFWLAVICIDIYGFFVNLREFWYVLLSNSVGGVASLFIRSPVRHTSEVSAHLKAVDWFELKFDGWIDYRTPQAWLTSGHASTNSCFMTSDLLSRFRKLVTADRIELKSGG